MSRLSQERNILFYCCLPHVGSYVGLVHVHANLAFANIYNLIIMFTNIHYTIVLTVIVAIV